MPKWTSHDLSPTRGRGQQVLSRNRAHRRRKRNLPGAAALAARAAQRSGAGYTQVWSAPDAVHDVRAGRPSLVVRPWDSLDLARALRRDASRNAAVLVGPGTGGSDVVTRDLLEIALDSPPPHRRGRRGLSARSQPSQPKDRRSSLTPASTTTPPSC